MDTREALRILKANWLPLNQERRAELADNEDLREPIDEKAEARALAALFDFLRDCKISHTDSLLRALEAICAKSRGLRQRHPKLGRASEAPNDAGS
jgi:hypothetical protein